jgi:hypothetical protein
VLVVAGLTAAGVFSFAAWRCGGPREAAAWLQGTTVLVESAGPQAVQATPGESVALGYNIVNLQSAPLTIYGADAGCACTTAENVPIEIAPFGRSRLTMRVKIRDDAHAGHISVRTRVFTNPVVPIPVLNGEIIVAAK